MKMLICIALLSAGLANPAIAQEMPYLDPINAGAVILSNTSIAQDIQSYVSENQGRLESVELTAKIRCFGLSAECTDFQWYEVKFTVVTGEKNEVCLFDAQLRIVDQQVSNKTAIQCAKN